MFHGIADLVKSLSIGLAGILLVTAPAVSFPCQISAQPQGVPAYEQALRDRVNKFYGLMRLGRFDDAEAFITDDTKPNFREEPKGPFLSFEIVGIKFETQGSAGPTRARVTVSLEIFTPPNPQTVSRQAITPWIRAGDTWLLESPKFKNADFRDLTKSAPRKPLPPVEVKFEKDRFAMGNVIRGQKATARFAFKNISDHPVSLEVSTFCDCLVVKNLKAEYKPGESGEFTVEFDSTEYLDEYAQTIVAKSSPGGAETHLLITGYVPRPPPPAEKPK